MTRHIRTTRGIGTIKFIVSVLLIGIVSYVLVQLLYPYYAYQRVEGIMQEWVHVAVHRSDRDPTEMIEKIRWLVDRYRIPMDPDDIRIAYDPETKVLSVYTEYDVYVEIPGYTQHYHFKPYAEAEGK